MQITELRTNHKFDVYVVSFVCYIFFIYFKDLFAISESALVKIRYFKIANLFLSSLEKFGAKLH